MHRQWKSDHYSSHYLGPKGVVPKTGVDVQEVLRTRIAELFPKVPKDQILIEQFTRRDLSCEQGDDDDCEAGQSALLHTLTATFNGKTATFQQVANGHVVDHEEPAAMSARLVRLGHRTTPPRGHTASARTAVILSCGARDHARATNTGAKSCVPAIRCSPRCHR